MIDAFNGSSRRSSASRCKEGFCSIHRSFHQASPSWMSVCETKPCLWNQRTIWMKKNKSTSEHCRGQMLYNTLHIEKTIPPQTVEYIVHVSLQKDPPIVTILDASSFRMFCCRAYPTSWNPTGPAIAPLRYSTRLFWRLH